MNLLISDSFKEKKEACDINDNTIRTIVDEKFKNDLYQNTSNIYNNRIDQHSYYTMPNTKVPNDQKTFAEWLYKRPINCDETTNNKDPPPQPGPHNRLVNSHNCTYTFKNLSELKNDLLK